MSSYRAAIIDQIRVYWEANQKIGVPYLIPENWWKQLNLKEWPSHGVFIRNDLHTMDQTEMRGQIHLLLEVPVKLLVNLFDYHACEYYK